MDVEPAADGVPIYTPGPTPIPVVYVAAPTSANVMAPSTLPSAMVRSEYDELSKVPGSSPGIHLYAVDDGAPDYELLPKRRIRPEGYENMPPIPTHMPNAAAILQEDVVHS